MRVWLPRSEWLAIALALFVSACPWEGPATLGSGEVRSGNLRGYVVPRPTQAGQGHVAGDLALAGPALSVEVRTAGPSEEHGAVVAVRKPKDAFGWESLRPLLSVDGLMYTPRVTGVRLARVGGRPAIVIDAIVSTDYVELRLRRTLRIADVRSALRITSHVRVSRGQAPHELTVVERVAFGGGYQTAPLHGHIKPDAPVEAEWLAHPVGKDALVLAALEGTVRIVGRNVDHGRADLVRYSDVSLPTPQIGKRSYQAEAVLSTSQAGLGHAVRALGWVRKKPFVEAWVTLDAHPPDAHVELVDATHGALVVLAVPDEKKRAALPIPDAALGTPLVVLARARGVSASPLVPLDGPPYLPVTLSIPESSSLRVSVTQAGTGDALPARVRVLPLRGTNVPNLGPDWSARGALDTLIVAGGRTEIRLPPGYYRVIVTHGPEWTVVDKSLELGVGKRVDLDAELTRAVDPGAWVPCELHVHQAPSPDSQVTLEDRVASLVAEGIAFAVPTDHNHVTDLGDAIAAQPLWGLFSVPGVEVTTADPAFGHFNAYPYPLDPGLSGQGAPEYRGLTPSELFSSLHALDPDLMVQVNHPRLEGGIGYFDVAAYDAPHDHGSALWSHDFDALEVWNGFDLARWANVERVLGEWLSMLEHGHRIVATGSSDSHTIRSEGAGYPRTYVRAPLAGVAHGKDLIGALREGRAFVTSGPFLGVRIGEQGIGDSVTLRDEDLALQVFVQVPAWMQVTTLRVYLGTELLRSVPLGPASASNAAGSRYQRTLRLRVDRPGPLVVTVEGEPTLQPIIARKGVKPFAFSNPIWLVPEGQATVPSEAVPELGEDAGLLQPLTDQSGQAPGRR